MPIEEGRARHLHPQLQDLRAIEHVQRLTEIGIDSFKIEGPHQEPLLWVPPAGPTARPSTTPSPGSLDPALLASSRGSPTAGYTDGFYQRHTPRDTNYLRGHSEVGRSLYVGDVVAYDAERGLAEIASKNAFSVGDRIELIHPSGNSRSAGGAPDHPAGDGSPACPAATTGSGSPFRLRPVGPSCAFLSGG